MNSLLLSCFLCAALAETVKASSITAQQTRSAPAAQADCVILIHGLGRTPLSMMRLEWTLERAGYKVVNFGYPSRQYNVEQLAEKYLDKAVAAQGQARQIHFVTHSLGGIVLRQYLAAHAMTNLGRVVMLAPPNHGSELADRLKQSALGRWILGPAGCEVGRGALELPERLGPAHFPLGVIAAAGPVHRWWSQVFSGPNDGKVSVQSAQLNGMADFLVVPGSHTWIMWRADTARQVLSFLQHGHFARDKRA
ncbi:MAG: alpha/beta fold hydrolase [Verrucomicrobiota bacterium]